MCSFEPVVPNDSPDDARARVALNRGLNASERVVGGGNASTHGVSGYVVVPKTQPHQPDDAERAALRRAYRDTFDAAPAASGVNLLLAFHEIADVLDSNEWETVTGDTLRWRNMLVEIEAVVAKTLHALVVEEDAVLRRRAVPPAP